MKRFSIIAVLSLLASVLGIVAGAAPASASNGDLRFLIYSVYGSDSKTSTLTYGEGLSLRASVKDDSLSCFNYPHDCDNPTGTIDFWSQVGSPWVDNGPNQTKLSGDNALVPFISELDPDRPSGISDADGGIYCCLHPAEYLIRAYYVPGNFEPNSATKGITVNKASGTPTLEQSSTSTAVGQAVTLTATVPRVTNRLADGPTGAVSFVEGDPGNTTQYGTALVGSDGKASITTTLIPPGSHSIRAVYAGDTNYASGESTSVSHSVAKGSTTTSLSGSATSTVFGQPVTLTGTVAPTAPAAGTPTGSVSFVDFFQSVDGNVIGTRALNGGAPDTATFQTSSLAVGLHNLGAGYGGDTNFFGSSSTSFYVTVSKANTTTVLTSSGSTSNFGQSVTFTAGVTTNSPGTGTPTGTVQFKDGSTNLGAPKTLSAGAATLTLSTLGGGTHTITAVYSGDAGRNGSTSGPVTQTVTCDRTISGSASSYTVPATGSTCITGGTISGSVSIPAGAKVSLVNVNIAGSVMASNPGSITICGSTIGGAVSIGGATGFVLIGDPFEDACAGNNIRSAVSLYSNKAGLDLGANSISGSVSVTGTTGSGPAPDHTRPEVEANSIGSSLGCSGNSPTVWNDGRPNSVAGTRSGECGAAGF